MREQYSHLGDMIEPKYNTMTFPSF